MTDLDDAGEELALALTRNGMQRMTARVFAAFLFTDEPSLTLGDLVDGLGISAGSGSAAIRTLLAVGMLEQVPARGSRRDHYRIREDAWVILFSAQNEAVQLMRDAAERGVAAAAPGGPAHRRLASMRDFHAFMLSEIPALIERWHTRDQNGA